MALPQISEVDHAIRKFLRRDAEFMAQRAVLLLDLIEDCLFAIRAHT